MFGLDNPSGVSVMPPVTPASNPTPLWFTEGGAGLAVSYPGQEWFNIVQAELLAVLQEAGIKPDKSKLNQLAVAIKSIAAERGIELTDKLGNSSTLAASQKLVTEINDNANNKLAKNQNGADIPDKNAFVKNLGLSETVNRANGAVPSSRKVNGKALSGDISLSAGDVGALPISSTLNAQTGTLRINNGSNWPNIEFRAANKHFIGIEGTAGNRLTIYANDENGNRKYTLATPEKSSTLATLDDITVPVGSPIPWPQPNPPSGYLACNGQAFNKSIYPKLAAAYPSGTLPDLRGEFIRGWDDGRGVDSGRGILSYQEGQAPVSAIAGYWDNNWKNGKHRDTGFSAATGTNNGSYHEIIQEYESQRETRPRNIAFNYIVRAA